METKKVYQVVIVRGNSIDTHDHVLCLSKESLEKHLQEKVESLKDAGYEETARTVHKWQTYWDLDNLTKVVTIERQMTKENEFGKFKCLIGYITYEAE